MRRAWAAVVRAWIRNDGLPRERWTRPDLKERVMIAALVLVTLVQLSLVVAIGVRVLGE